MSNCVRTASTSSSANRDAEARTNPAASENGTMTSTSVPSAGRAPRANAARSWVQGGAAIPAATR